ncbi:MAG: aminopeptidase P family protein [Erysipelotrichaceae bacterium]|nr:aminopeptidase P family protein [Erysipelotrichaceae bacterium]
MDRINNLQQLLIDKHTDACLISDPDCMHYFIQKKFHCGERMVVLLIKKTGKPVLFLNKMFPCEPTELFDLVNFDDTEDAVAILAKYVEGTIAIDKTWNAGFLLKLMSYLPEAKFINATEYSDLIRSIKSEEELEKMREASRLNDKVMERVKTLIKVGKTEAQLRDEIDAAFLEIAHSTPSFETIVAFKENGANPHAEPSDKVLEEGMGIIIDMGCKYENYCSDMTRTFFLKENTMKEVYDTVLKANLAGIAAVKPGVRFKDIDHAARKVIEEAGYGEYFIHRLGHGIGLSVHEPYDVSATDEIIVQPGMCFSIEPGIYLPGIGGVRIEDLVVCTKDGVEVLNHYPKDNEIVD